MYSTMYADSAFGPGAEMLSLFTSFIAGYSILLLILSVIMIIANWRIFSKADQPGWAAIVPVYNMVVQYKIVGLNPWLLILFIVPFVNFIAIPVLGIMVPFKLAKAFGKGAGWGFGLLFLPFIFYLILAFGTSEYVGVSENA